MLVYALFFPAEKFSNHEASSGVPMQGYFSNQICQVKRKIDINLHFMEYSLIVFFFPIHCITNHILGMPYNIYANYLDHYSLIIYAGQVTTVAQPMVVIALNHEEITFNFVSLTL